MVLQPTLAFGLFHHGDELFFGDALLFRGVEELDSSFLEQAEEQLQGSENDQADPQGGRGPHAEFLCLVIGQGLGGDFPKNQHHNGEDDGRRGWAVDRSQQFGKQDGAQRRGGQVDDVVADKDTGENFVILFQQNQGFLRP